MPGRAFRRLPWLCVLLVAARPESLTPTFSLPPSAPSQGEGATARPSTTGGR